MPFSPTRFAKYYGRVIGHKPGRSIEEKLSGYGAAKSQPKKAEIIRGIADDTIQIEGARILSEIMLSCGTECICKSTLYKAGRLYRKSEDLEHFIQLLNQNHIGGGRLKMGKGVITGGYDKCCCGSVSGSKHTMPIEYCHCSAGWYKQLFGTVLQKEVKVEILSSIISGSNCCNFRIYI